MNKGKQPWDWITQQVHKRHDVLPGTLNLGDTCVPPIGAHLSLSQPSYPVLPEAGGLVLCSPLLLLHDSQVTYCLGTSSPHPFFSGQDVRCHLVVHQSGKVWLLHLNLLNVNWPNLSWSDLTSSDLCLSTHEQKSNQLCLLWKSKFPGPWRDLGPLHPPGCLTTDLSLLLLVSSGGSKSPNHLPRLHMWLLSLLATFHIPIYVTLICWYPE